jgi:hypothetical protein
MILFAIYLDSVYTLKPSVPCRALRHVKEPKSDVEVATVGNIDRPFLAHSFTFRCRVRWRRFRRWGPPLAKVGTLEIPGSPPRWGFDVPLATALCKTFLLRMLNDS